MRLLVILKLKRICKFGAICRGYSSHEKKIRNIAILAHIDAGKTTTTERMLFYSGKTRSLGEVHRGNTVTDFLRQERERGITICSSAVTIPWKNHKINIIDTPGHIDFTMEVEQSLSAVDGVVIVLDGTAGVEAQTMTVWHQADRYSLPKIVFVNKMDRNGAIIEANVKDIEQKFDIHPVSLQMPLEDENGFSGIIDVINLKLIQWKSETLGREYLTASLPVDMTEIVTLKRIQIIDDLCDRDDELAEAFILGDNYSNVTRDMILQSIRKLTLARTIVPVLLGSAYKNVGIQPLMDSILQYLPTPFEKNNSLNYFEGDNFAGKIFKIMHDKQRGALTLVRVLRGNLKKGMRVITARSKAEVVQKIYEPLADEYKEVAEVETGDIGVCTGLKNTVTGDVLATSLSAIKAAEEKLHNALSVAKSDVESKAVDNRQNNLLLQPKIPDPVYFCSIEPPSLSQQNALESALKQLQREDPSLRVRFEEETGQIVLGMGELHIDIIKSRILSEYKIDASLGNLQVAYKETIESDCMGTWTAEKEITGAKQHVSITLSLTKDYKEPFSLDMTPDNISNVSTIRPQILQIVKQGALSGLERGPRVGGQVVETAVKLHSLTIGRGTANSFLMAAAFQCVQKILNDNRTRLLEPIMEVEIISPTECVSIITLDLSKRRGIINNVSQKGSTSKIIKCTVPLSEITGYSNTLRTISSGTANVTMQFYGYTAMNPQEENVAERRTHGWELS